MPKLELYVHRSAERRVEIVEVDTEASLAEAIGATEVDLVWINDIDGPVDAAAQVGDLGLEDRGHVHVGRCNQINATVHFESDTKQNHFSPNADVGRVFDWATSKKGFNLSDTDRTEHVLLLCDTKVEPDENDHLGSLADDTCGVCFNLVPKHRFEG